jgi:TPP-dependent pyruvate/acetoin dehydrogenase alpha subunit
VLAVREAFGCFLASARSGGGPSLLECLTHRLRGHYEGDPQLYRQAIAAEEWQELDPILRLQRALGHDGFEEEARAEVGEALDLARSSPFPPPELTEELVYAG